MVGTGVDIPDLIVMAMASLRRASVLTWDFRHFRAVVLRRGHHWPLVVDEVDLPSGSIEHANQQRRTKKRAPPRDPMPLLVPGRPNQVWSADFMSDALYNGIRFRTFNVLDDFNREALAIEIDTSLPSTRLVRVFEQLKSERGLPDVLRTDNGPEFLGEAFTSWCEANGILIDYIEPGKPKQNPFIERFNRSYREEVLDTWLFRTLDEVRRAHLGVDARVQRGERSRPARRTDPRRSPSTGQSLYF